jgi:N-acetylglucosaminyldiphosphoundecaprenol N-acetyl-beta-D-mannosaminyltransferase
VQYICPPQQSLEDFDFDSLATQLAALSPDIVWVGLGTPKQDFVAHELASRLDSTIVAVGAAFDFYSGTKKQAPRWIQATYLEWLFRLLSEPKRLWKRYLIGNIGFVSDIALWVLSARKRQS